MVSARAVICISSPLAVPDRAVTFPAASVERSRDSRCCVIVVITLQCRRVGEKKEGGGL